MKWILWKKTCSCWAKLVWSLPDNWHLSVLHRAPSSSSLSSSSSSSFSSFCLFLQRMWLLLPSCPWAESSDLYTKQIRLSLTETHAHAYSHTEDGHTLLHLIKVVEVCVGRWIWWKGWGFRKCFTVCTLGVACTHSCMDTQTRLTHKHTAVSYQHLLSPVWLYLNFTSSLHSLCPHIQPPRKIEGSLYQSLALSCEWLCVLC